MTYRFLCPQCGKTKEITMRITEYKADGHLCECGAELVRDPQDFCTSYAADCEGFYARYQSN